MDLLMGKYVFDQCKYKVIEMEQNAVFISDELFKLLIVNQTGKRILSYMDGANTLQDILQRLSGEYGLGVDVIAGMVEEYVKGLLEKNIIAEENHPSATSLEAGKDSLKRLYVELTDRCDLSCKFCSKANKGNRELTMNTANAIAELLSKESDDAVDIFIDGGEPLLHRRFVDILATLNMNGRNRLYLFTNAIHLDEGVVKAMKPYVNAAMLALAHSDRAVNDSMMSDGQYQSFFQGVQRLKQYAIPVYMSVLPIRDNIANMAALQQLAYDHGLNGVYIQEPIRFKEDGSPITTFFDYSQALYQEKILEIRKTNSYLNSWKNNRIKEAKTHFSLVFEKDRCCNRIDLIRPKPHCGIAVNEVSIDADGTVYPCHMLHNEKFQMGSIPDFLERRKLYAKEKITNEKCLSCDYWIICLGGCRADTYVEGGSLDALSSHCEKRISEINDFLENAMEY